jgi:F-type H+-transporting ATPase subunit delta
LTGNIVARRYARALYAIGKEKGLGELETYGADLKKLADILAGSSELLRVLRNPIFSEPEKKAVLGKVLATFAPSNMVANFCNLLVDKKRIGVLLDIEAYFSSFLDAEKGVVRGQLMTAIDLDAAKQDAIKASLEKQSGKKLVLDFAADASILGGVVLKIGDKTLDASLRAQLDILKENIKRGE